MKLFTSRFSNPQLNSGEYFAVGITLGKPKYKLPYEEGYHSYLLAPRGWMWKIESDDDFNREYAKMLDSHENEVAQELRKIGQMAKGKDVVLLCYEDVRDPSQSCHRTVLAEWITQHFNVKVEELPDPSPCKAKKRKPKLEQLTLMGLL